MDLRQVKHIMKEFEDSKIDKLEITEKDFSIKLEKNQLKHIISNSPSIPDTEVATEFVATRKVEDKAENHEDYMQIKAPLVGTFYESPSPDASPFVRLNQKVNKGDTLFIVEAMKVMNEITAPISGTIVKINVSEATMVEFGQVVMEMKE